MVACLLDPAYAAPWEARTGAVAAALSAARSEATRAALFAALLPQAAAMVDREAHDALTAEELLIFQTPAGRLHVLLLGFVIVCLLLVNLFAQHWSC